MTTLVHEGDVGSVPPNEILIHVGINSCMSITCVCDNRVVGGHAVMMPGDGIDTLANILRRMRVLLQGKNIRRVYIIGSLGNWQSNMSSAALTDSLGTDYFTRVQPQFYMQYNRAFEPVPVETTVLRDWIKRQVGFDGPNYKVTVMTTGRLADATVNVAFGNGRVRVYWNANVYLNQLSDATWPVPHNMHPNVY